MGIYDSVWARCPSCNARIDFQSKAGRCELTNYISDSVPPAIAAAIDGDKRQCECGVIVVIGQHNPARIRMTVSISS